MSGKPKTGGPAYPIQGSISNGMSVRDVVAKGAHDSLILATGSNPELQDRLQQQSSSEGVEQYDVLAQESFKHADAWLEAREVTQ